MRITDFLKDFADGKIDPMSEVPMHATELNDMLMEYIASIKMHRATLNENDSLRNTSIPGAELIPDSLVVFTDNVGFTLLFVVTVAFCNTFSAFDC